MTRKDKRQQSKKRKEVTRNFPKKRKEVTRNFRKKEERGDKKFPQKRGKRLQEISAKKAWFFTFSPPFGP
jgi:hypothetical protein